MQTREMRRSAQRLPQEECEAILERNSSGVLAVTGDGGWPYAVPLSYAFADGALFFHCAKTGCKLDAIRADERACFTVIDRDEVVPEEYTTYYKSVIAFGRARVIEDGAQMLAAIEVLAKKYHPTDSPQGRKAAIEKDFSRLTMIRLDVEWMTGKQARELMKAKS